MKGLRIPETELRYVAGNKHFFFFTIQFVLLIHVLAHEHSALSPLFKMCNSRKIFVIVQEVQFRSEFKSLLIPDLTVNLEKM